MRMDTAVAGRCRAKQSLPACRSGPATAHSVHPMAGRQCSSAARQVVCRVSVADPPSSTTKQMESQLRSKAPAAGDLNQQIREGHYEAELVQQQVRFAERAGDSTVPAAVNAGGAASHPHHPCRGLPVAWGSAVQASKCCCRHGLNDIVAPCSPCLALRLPCLPDSPSSPPNPMPSTSAVPVLGTWY